MQPVGLALAEIAQHFFARTRGRKMQIRRLRAHGLDPDRTSWRGDEQEQMAPYQRPMIRECHEAYIVAKACLRDPEASLRGFRLANLWGGQALAAVAAPALVEQQRHAIVRKRATQAAAAANRRRGERTRDLVAKSGLVGDLSERHVRRISPKKKK